MTPLWGLHLWIILAIGLPLRLDVPIAYLAANISIPPILPFITIAEIELGSLVRTGAFIGMRRADLATRGVASFLRDLWVGTAILGPLLAAIGGSLTYAAVSRRRTHSSEVDPDPMNRVADRYAGGSVATRMYVSSKLHADPIGRALLERSGSEGTLGAVLDVGCGRGQLALLLLEAGVATSVRGVDWEESKVDDATRAATTGRSVEATFTAGDIRTVAFDTTDTVLLIDILHYFAEEEQSTLVAKAARAAKKRVIIRDIDPDRGFRSTLTRLQEWLTTGAAYNRGDRVLVRPIATLTGELAAAGFRVTVSPCWGKTPFSNVLLIAERA